jgi:hypothetical protein
VCLNFAIFHITFCPCGALSKPAGRSRTGWYTQPQGVSHFSEAVPRLADPL